MSDVDATPFIRKSNLRTIYWINSIPQTCLFELFFKNNILKNININISLNTDLNTYYNKIIFCLLNFIIELYIDSKIGIYSSKHPNYKDFVFLILISI